MKAILKLIKQKDGIILVMSIVILALMSVTVTGISLLNSHNILRTKIEVARSKAYYAADGGINYALWRIGHQDQTPVPDNLSFTYNMNGMNIPVNISISNVGQNQYRVISRATIGNKTRTITATIAYTPPAKVLDYSYFINNWGWYYGNTIVDLGDIRSNGPFSFANYRPTIHGDIYAHMDIEGGSGIRGPGGNPRHQHPYSPTLSMPNINSFAETSKLAREKHGVLKIGSTVIVDGALGDDPGEKENLYLYGTRSNPIVIDGPVAVKGDVIIKGYITGQGTIYAGRNIYIADDVKYLNPPTGYPPDWANKIGWIRNNIDKDLVCYAAAGNIILGDHTRSSWWWDVEDWVNNSMNESSEYHLGPDGIPNTPDDGTPYDADGDGTIDPRATYSDFDFGAPLNPAYFKNLPYYVRNRYYYSSIATSGYINEVDGILYCNHFVIGTVGWGSGVTFYGALISRNESIIYSNYIIFRHDPRLDSKYLRYYDVYELLSLDLGLPTSEARAKVLTWTSS